MRDRSRRRASAACEVFDFERDGAKPDGTPVKLAFSLAFARDPNSPDVRFAVCQHHFPENFWDPAFQTHANGARSRARCGDGRRQSDRPPHLPEGVYRRAAICIRVRSASRLAPGMAMSRSWSRLRFAISSGFRPTLDGEGMTLNAMRFAVADMPRSKTLHRQNGIASRAPCRTAGGAAATSPMAQP